MAGPHSPTSLRVVAISGDQEELDWLGQVLGQFEVAYATAANQLQAALRTSPHIVILGSLNPAEHTACVRQIEAIAPITLVLASTTNVFAPVDETRLPVYYRISPKLTSETIDALFRRAVSRPASTTNAPSPGGISARRTQQVLEQVRRIATLSDLKATSRAVQSSLMELVGANRARCLFYDEDSGEAWMGDGDGESFNASRGISGLALRTGRGFALTEVGDHPAWDKTIDDPAGGKRDRFIAYPVHGRDGHVHALLVAIRSGDKPAFTAEEVEIVTVFAREWAPFVDQLARVEEAKQQSAEENNVEPARQIFRQDAIIHMVRGGNRGDVVRVHPGWIGAAYWITIGAVVAGIAFAAFARVPQFASGQAVIRFTGREDVVAYGSGTVTDVLVQRGDRVRPRQLLARLNDSSEESGRRAHEANFKSKLNAYLMERSNQSASKALAEVMVQREKINADLEARLVRAPFAGTVKEVYVRRGQTVAGGKVILAMATEGRKEELTILAFLPGSEMPRIRPGQSLQMKLPGYRGAVLNVPVDSVSAEVLGADEAKARYLPDRAAANVAIEGAVVVVSGRLPSASFEADGQIYALHDGMVGYGEVQLSSKSIFRSLLPDDMP